ncbi:LAGLIDADG family homing endonuclease [Nanoarchaeota archaeon]
MIKVYHSKKYLIEQLKKKTYIQIANENSVSTDTIHHWMSKYGLTKKNMPWTDGEIKLLKDNYGKDVNIYKLFNNRSISSINHKASRLGLKRHFRNRMYSIDHYFFKQWSAEMAYVLGFFFSDGDVSSDKRCIRIHLHKQDHYILEIISGVMGSNRPVRFYSNSVTLRLDSKMLVTDIIKLGCTPRKSKTLRFPRIKNKFLSHFIRGYFDGDGSIHFNKPNTIKVSFFSTKEFLQEMQDRISKSLKIKKNPIKELKSVYRVYYYGNDARKLCKWMYKDSNNLYLKRKKERFDKHLELRKNG